MNNINESWYTSKTQEWATPQKVFDELDAEFHFTLDLRSGAEAGLCSEERSMISPDYARNFICDFILGKEQVGSQMSLF